MFPFFSIWDYQVFTYPLLMGAAWGICFFLYKELLLKLKINFKSPNFIFWGLFITSWIGAKLTFILTTQGIEVSQYAYTTNFWLGGGFVFYGGLIFGLIFLLISSKIKSIPFKKFEVFIPLLSLGHAVGRIGCLLAGCCYGSHTNFFIHVYLHNKNRHPVQIYESVALFILAYISYRLLLKDKSVIPFYLIGYGLLRFSLEFIRGDKIRGLWAFGFSTSQIISLIIVFLTAGYVITNSLRRAK